MVRQLIAAAISLLIYNALEGIQYTQAILDFRMLAQYITYHDEMLSYIEHVLYTLLKTKIALEQYWLINAKLCQLIFNYPKFLPISHFVRWIWDYCNAVNYDTAQSEMAHKHYFKVFYNRINKMGYESQI